MASSPERRVQVQEFRGRFGKVLFRNEESGATIAFFHLFPTEFSVGEALLEEGAAAGVPLGEEEPASASLRVRGKFSPEDLESPEVTLWGRFREGRGGRFFYVSDGDIWRGLAPGAEEPPEQAVALFCAEAFRGRRFGPAAARKLNDALGGRAWAALTREPHTLAQALGAERALELYGIVQSITVARASALAHLLGMGLSWAYAQRALGAYGTRAVERVREDPYCLIGVRGVQFSTADRIASKGFSIPPLDPRRLRALCVAVLAEAASQGHTSLEEGEVAARVEVLGGLAALGLSAADLVKRTVAEGALAADMGDIYLPRLLASERQAAEHLARLLLRPNRAFRFDFSTDPELASYSAEQREAIRQGLCAPVVLINGRPGSGKTTVACEIVRLAQRFGIPVTLTATTGNAADRLSEAMAEGGLDGQKIIVEPAETIQSVAGNHSPGKPLPRGIVVIDEAGMMDLPLFARVLANAGDNTSLVLLGDPDQLPPVVAGAASRDVKDSSVVTVVELTTVRRQGENTLIAINGDRIRKGLTPIFYGDPLYPNILAQTGVTAKATEIEVNAYFREAHDPLAGALKVVDTVRRLSGQDEMDPLRDIQVYAPMRRGYMGTHNLNRLLQELHNPEGEGVRVITTLRFPLLRKSQRPLRTPRKKRSGVVAGPMPLPLRTGDEVVPATRGKGATAAKHRLRITQIFPDGSLETERSDGERRHFSREEMEGLAAVYDLSLRVGDPVVHLRNDKKGRGLVNGMRGILAAVTPEGGAVVQFYNGRRVDYSRAQLPELAIAYAATIHKGQGQQQLYSVLALHHSEHIVMLERGLLLVGMTRAQRKVVVVGTDLALRMALRNARGYERRTRLVERAAKRLAEIGAERQGGARSASRNLRARGDWSSSGQPLPTARQSVILQATEGEGMTGLDDLFSPLPDLPSPPSPPSRGQTR